MRDKVFKYTKEDGTTSDRKILVIRETIDDFEGIDLKEFTPTEQQQLAKLNEEYELALQPFIKKGFRRFKKNRMRD